MFYHDSFAPESLTGSDLDHLLDHGWYRMHQSLFTTSHVELDNLYRVHWLRYNVLNIENHRSHRRLKSLNKHFNFTIENLSGIREDHIDLHARYRASIDFDGALNIKECLFGENDPGKNIFDTRCISIFDQNKLVAGGYFDLGERGAASILHFYDPLYKPYGLGKYLILLTLDFLRENGYQWYYPGYVVQGLSKMDYKLFLGRETAAYFEPETVAWKKFHEKILLPVPQDFLQLLKGPQEGEKTI